MKSGLFLSFSVAGFMLTAQAMAADAPAVAANTAVHASDAATKVSAGVAVKPSGTAGKVVKQTGGVIGKSGENQYPTGSPVIPPKPKKEGLEAAGAIKAKAAQP